MQPSTLIDFRKDSETIYNHIIQSVHNYNSRTNSGSGNIENPISLITLGFQIDQSCWVALVFDTRPGAKPDGKWTSHIKENAIEFRDWLEAIDSLIEHDVEFTITLTNGMKKVIDINTDMEDIAAYFGDMLRNVLLLLRDEGVFSDLPLSEKCFMCVEELNGYYGWPIYENLIDEGVV